MPSLADLRRLAIPVGAQVAGGIINRRASGNAAGTLAAGANTAIGTINAGADRARQTLGDINTQQRTDLAPFSAAGQQGLEGLTEGLRPGGGLADPFQYDFNQFFNDPQIQRRIAEGNKLLARKQASGGSLSSGAALKAARDYNDYQIGNEFSKERGEQERIFRQNQEDRYGRLMGLEQIGQAAVTTGVNAGSAYGGNLARLEQTTAQQIADLETDRASAEALGDVNKANAITDSINGILKTFDSDQLAQTAKAGVKPVTKTLASLAPSAVPLTGLAGGTSALAGAGATTLSAGTLAGIPGIGVGGGAVAAPVAPGAAAGAGGLAPAITGFLTNPITIGVGAALAGALIWKKSQAHPTADKWVQGYQNKFDQHMDKINRAFHTAAQSGQLSRADAQQMRDQAAAFAMDYEKTRQEFSGKGGKERTVAQQALNTLNQQYGPQFSGFLGRMDQIISGLA